MEHTTTGLPIDNRLAVQRAYDIVIGRGYMREDHLLRAVLPEGDGFDRKSIWSDLQAGPIAAGTLVMVWTKAGYPYYLTPVHALRIADRLTWVEDKGETIPVVQDAAALAL